MAQNQPRGLTQRGREIVEHRYALAGAKHMTLSELAGKYDLSTHRIRQIEYVAIRKVLLAHLGGMQIVPPWKGKC